MNFPLLPPPPPRTGTIPRYRLHAARDLRDFLNAKSGFAACGYRAVLSLTRGGFGVHLFHPPGECMPEEFPDIISGVPITSGAAPVKKPRR